LRHNNDICNIMAKKAVVANGKSCPCHIIYETTLINKKQKI